MGAKKKARDLLILGFSLNNTLGALLNAIFVR